MSPFFSEAAKEHLRAAMEDLARRFANRKPRARRERPSDLLSYKHIAPCSVCGERIDVCVGHPPRAWMRGKRGAA